MDPVIFPSNSNLPDPFDHLLRKDESSPGHVRELKNAVSKAMLKAYADQKSPVLQLEDHFFDSYACQPSVRRTAPEPVPYEEPTAGIALRQRLELFQKREIMHAVEQVGGNWAKAAELLGLNRSNLHHLVKRLGLK